MCASFSESGKSPLSNDKLIMLAMTDASSLAHFFKRLVGTGSSILLEEEDLDIRLKTCCTDTAENFSKNGMAGRRCDI